MDEQRQDDQIVPTYSSSALIRDVALKTCQKQWTIEKVGERGSGIFVLMARRDDDDDDADNTVGLSLSHIVADRMRYNLESAQYLW